MLQSQARLDEAAAIYAEILERQGDDVAPRKRAATLNNLANLHSNQGKYDAAVDGYLQALDLYEADLGPDHPEVGLALTNLGNVYEWQGKYDEALVVHQRDLGEAIRAPTATRSARVPSSKPRASDSPPCPGRRPPWRSWMRGSRASQTARHGPA